MVAFLEQGYVYYVVMAVVGIGLVGKWMARRAYRRLILQAEDMMEASSEWLRQLRQRYEAFYKKRGQACQTELLIDKYMYRNRCLGMRLGTLERMLMLTAIGVGVITMSAAFGAYKYGLSSEIVTDYLFVGLLTVGSCFWLDQLLDTDRLRRALRVHIQDYFENTLKYRLETEESLQAEDSGTGIRDDLFIKKEEPQETGLARWSEPKLLQERKSRGKRVGPEPLSGETSYGTEPERSQTEETMFGRKGASAQTAATLEAKKERRLSEEQEQFMELVQRMMEQLK